MKIAAGFSKVSEVRELIRLGADELFCGLTHEKYSLNHRPNEERFNLGSLGELRESVRIAGKINIMLAINAIICATSSLSAIFGLV